MGFLDRLQHGWNAFIMNKDPTNQYRYDYGMSYSYRPDRPRLTRGNERSIVTAIYNRIALDVAAINIKHCELDKNERFLGVVNSNLNSCLNLEANIDQTGRAFIQDVVMSMLDEGVVTIVPIDTSIDPNTTGTLDILSMRTGKITQWYPRHVKVLVYNDRTGNKEELIMPKSKVCIIENPLYAVINEPNSTMQRLIRKLSLLDIVDEQSSAGKLDLIVQLPYVIKTQARREEADRRRKEIEMQLANSKYGIAYTDGTERITQLNRPVENNLMKQIEYLTNMLFSQLGITQTILEGTADEQTMLNYNNRTIEPIISAIVDEMKRKFLSKTARSQMKTIMFFRDPFRLVPVNSIAEIADKFTRNEIMTSNEFRQIVGLKPSDDPKADQLINSNINQSATGQPTNPTPNQTQADVQTVGEELTEEPSGMTSNEYKKAIGELDAFDTQIDSLEYEMSKDKNLKHYASPYYDPAKAHEYYERTKELKGRKSTATLNEEGKNAARYVKEQLTNERKSKVDAHNASTQAQIKAKKASMDSTLNSKKADMNAEMESHKEQMQNKIDSLREKFDNMSTLDQVINQERIQAEIAKLREDNDVMRAKLQSEYSAERSKMREDYNSTSKGLRSEHSSYRSGLKTEYDEKYMSELDKIKSNAQFLKPTKRKRKS